jgi:DNA-binding response OmpR family regulator
METPSLIFRFGPFEARTCAQELSKNGTSVRLRGQPFAILELLVSRAGEVVTREEIRQKIWPVDTFVDFEHGLNTSIKKLRQALLSPATSRLCRDLATASSLQLRLRSNQNQKSQPAMQYRKPSPSLNLDLRRDLLDHLAGLWFSCQLLFC